MKVVLLSDIHVQATHPLEEVTRPNVLWGLSSLMSRHEFVHIGPALVSACESAAGFQIVARSRRFWRHYRGDVLGSDPFAAALSALVPSGDLQEDFGGVCCGVQQIFHKQLA